jgi:hypothetical protein
LQEKVILGFKVPDAIRKSDEAMLMLSLRGNIQRLLIQKRVILVVRRRINEIGSTPFCVDPPQSQ